MVRLACGTKVVERWRAVPPQVTLLHAKAWAELAGIHAVRDITAMGDLGVPVFVSERRSPAAYRYAFGKGRVPVEAEIGAYMEAIESYFVEPGVAKLETRRGKVLALPGCGAGRNPVLEFAPKLGCEFDPDDALLLANAQDVESGAQAWIPAELVFNPAPSGAGASLYGVSSNGLASGNSVLEASIHAVYELIERDVWSLEFLRNRSEWVDSADLPRDVRNIIETADQKGLRLVVRYVPNDYGIPFFAAFLFEPGRFERRFFNGGWGSHSVRDVALMRAVTEVAQSRAAFQLGFGNPGNSDMLGVEADRVRQQIAAVSSRTAAIRFMDIPEQPVAPDLGAQWSAAVSCLRLVIDRPIYRVIYTPLDGPLHVVRLIVPLLEHFTHSTKRMGPRMLAELEALARHSTASIYAANGKTRLVAEKE